MNTSRYKGGCITVENIASEGMQSTKPKFVFTCQRCGRCCERAEDIVVYLKDIEEWSKSGTIYQIFPDLLVSGEPVALYLKIGKADGKCKQYDAEKKECKIYDHRPIDCRAYPLKNDGSGYLVRDKECPGLNTGEMSKDALEAIRKAARDEQEEESRTAAVLPAIQALLMSEMVRKSEEAYSKLSEEEKAKLEEILKKEDS